MRDLVAKAKSDIDARMEILKSFEPLIKKCFKMYVRDYNYLEDTMQEGYITLLRCIENYDLSSKNAFPGYVKMAVIHNIRDFSKKIRNDLSLNDKASDEGSTFLDFLPSDVNIEEDEIHRHELMALGEAMNRLTFKQREIIEAFYYRNETLQDISINRRCHYMALSKLKSRAIKSLRKELSKYIEA